MVGQYPRQLRNRPDPDALVDYQSAGEPTIEQPPSPKSKPSKKPAVIKGKAPVVTKNSPEIAAQNEAPLLRQAPRATDMGMLSRAMNKKR